MAASEAAVTAVMEALCFTVPSADRDEELCTVHSEYLTDRGCPVAVAAADAAVDADRASIQAETLREAAGVADPWDDLHAAASWLMARADQIEGKP